MRLTIIFFFFIAGCSVKTTSFEDQNIITVAEGDKTYWLRTKNQIPIYPYRELKNRVDGCVNVSYLVNPAGNIESLIVVGSYPKAVFDRSALRAVSKFKYSATDLNIEKAPVRTNAIVTFLLGYPDYTSPSREIIKKNVKLQIKNEERRNCLIERCEFQRLKRANLSRRL